MLVLPSTSGSLHAAAPPNAMHTHAEGHAGPAGGAASLQAPLRLGSAAPQPLRTSGGLLGTSEFMRAASAAGAGRTIQRAIGSSHSRLEAGMVAAMIASRNYARRRCHRQRGFFPHWSSPMQESAFKCISQMSCRSPLLHAPRSSSAARAAAVSRGAGHQRIRPTASGSASMAASYAHELDDSFTGLERDGLMTVAGFGSLLSGASALLPGVLCSLHRSATIARS